MHGVQSAVRSLLATQRAISTAMRPQPMVALFSVAGPWGPRGCRYRQLNRSSEPPSNQHDFELNFHNQTVVWFTIRVLLS